MKISIAFRAWTSGNVSYDCLTSTSDVESLKDQQKRKKTFKVEMACHLKHDDGTLKKTEMVLDSPIEHINIMPFISLLMKSRACQKMQQSSLIFFSQGNEINHDHYFLPVDC